MAAAQYPQEAYATQGGYAQQPGYGGGAQGWPAQAPYAAPAAAYASPGSGRGKKAMLAFLFGLLGSVIAGVGGILEGTFWLQYMGCAYTSNSCSQSALQGIFDMIGYGVILISVGVMLLGFSRSFFRKAEFEQKDALGGGR
ncbi:MAG: hypothetical protein KGI98_14110 [Euryarchaeota archaeon]|nr:hypothetical protein [Euryarchaeota archaeon]MDE1881066.1 hypothetical protein [Euryarchaeota archaeon]